MKITRLGKVVSGQDGAVFSGFAFRFDEKGVCNVYKIANFPDSTPVAAFTLDKAEILAPHSNSVAFGSEYYQEGDEFPLLYTNLYNNYSKSKNQLKGVTCVYRIFREGDSFGSFLVGLIEIGFTEDPLWKSENGDVRPFGNFALDKKAGLYYAFTMRDGDKKTRYFSFKMPNLAEGVIDEKYGVKKVVLNKEDMLDYFDVDYHFFIQGAICEEGKIYSLEGFTDDKVNRPAIRIVDTAGKTQESVVYFEDLGSTVEPEFIDFEKGVCYYADNHGNFYKMEF